MSYELLAPTTAAATSAEFTTTGTARSPAKLCAPGLTGSETVTLQQRGGGVWENLILDSVTQQLTATHRALTIYGPGRYQLVKSATAAAVGIYCSTPDNP